MRFKSIDIVILNFTIMFAIAFFHFLFVEWLNVGIDKLVYLSLMIVNALLIFKIRKPKISKSFIKLFIFFIFFIFLLIYSIVEVFLYSAVIYFVYIFTQMILLTYIFSNMNYKEFLRVVLAYRNAYLLTTIPLFLLYLTDVLLNFYTLPNRFIVFDLYRFGGFVSEPRGMAIFSILSLSSILLIRRQRYQRLEVAFIVLVIFCTFSNTAFLALLLFPIIYYFFKQNLLSSLVYIISIILFFILGWNFLPDFSIGRFTFNKESISLIFKHLDTISDFDPGGINAFNIRLWIFLKGVMALDWYGFGFYSAQNIAVLKGLKQSNAIGIVTILADFGYLIGSLIVFYGLYLIKQYKMIDKNVFKFLSILILLILMSPPYSKFYLPLYVYFFVLFVKTKSELISRYRSNDKKREI